MFVRLEDGNKVDLTKLLKGLVAVVKDRLSTATTPMASRLAALESRIAELESRKAMSYKGVYETDRTYEAGDAITDGGCVWVAKERTTIRPSYTPESAAVWTLAVKRGRDGRDARR